MNHPFGTEIQNDFVARIRALSSARSNRLAALNSRADAEAYVREVQAKFRALFQFPTEKIPLNPVVTGELSAAFGTVRKLYFWSRPGVPVTATCYLPRTPNRQPGVLLLCGHIDLGKAGTTYATAAENLAERGFVVLVVDPCGQGERHMSRISNCCQEHNNLGKQLLLTGEWFGARRAYDAIRAVDYLISLPEVNPACVGVIGNSGGGTMTSYMTMLDDRLAFAAPSCYITSWRHNIENELPADLEQMPPGAAAAGLDMADLLIAGAPKKLLVLSQKNDFFDPRGTHEAYKEIQHIYRLLGRGEEVSLFVGPDSHGLSRPNREAIYQFCCRAAGIQADSVELHTEPTLSGKDLNVTENGSALSIPGARKWTELIGEAVETCRARRRENGLTGEALRKCVAEALNLSLPIPVPYWRVLRVDSHERSMVSRFGLETEPGRVMCVLKRLATGNDYYHIDPEKKVLLYIPHLDAESELVELAPEFDGAVYGLDVRGVGEMQPTGCGRRLGDAFFHEYHFDYHYASLAMLCGSSMLSGKVRDILAAMAIFGDAEITLRASGQGCVPSMLAAALSGQCRLVLSDESVSWEAMALEPETHWPLSAMLPGVLNDFDLPDLKPLIRV